MTEIETPRERAERWKREEKEIFEELDEFLEIFCHTRLINQTATSDPQFPNKQKWLIENHKITLHTEALALTIYILNRIRPGTPLFPDSVFKRLITDDDESAIDDAYFYLTALSAFLSIPKPKAQQSQVEHLRQSLIKDKIDIHLAKYRSAQKSYRKHGERANDLIIRAALDQLRVENPPTN
ncbi:MAG: hypothetical protein ABGZ53_32720 [Fuerstiella sp.]